VRRGEVGDYALFDFVWYFVADEVGDKWWAARRVWSTHTTLTDLHEHSSDEAQRDHTCISGLAPQRRTLTALWQYTLRAAPLLGPLGLVAKSQARRRRHALQCHTSDRRLRQSCLEAAGSGRTGPVPASPCRRACLSLKIEEGSYRAASPTARSMYPGGPHVHEFASPVQIG